MSSAAVVSGTLRVKVNTEFKLQVINMSGKNYYYMYKFLTSFTNVRPGSRVKVNTEFKLQIINMSGKNYYYMYKFLTSFTNVRPQLTRTVCLHLRALFLS